MLTRKEKIALNPSARKQKKSEKNRAANKLTFDKQFISHILSVAPFRSQPSQSFQSPPSNKVSS
jgi:hypothetical protein